MLSVLAQCDYAVEKSSLVFSMNQQEQLKYEELSKDIGKIKN